MTRLSLHHGDENPNLSIHLREGQYCTVGSSAAADYSYPSAGVEPVHCRIGCQSSGGYVECFDALASIFINDVRKNRSRVSNGDTLRIGSVELKVVMPEAEKSLSNFSVEFDAEESPTTEVAQAHSFGEEISSRQIETRDEDEDDDEKFTPETDQPVVEKPADEEPNPESDLAEPAQPAPRKIDDGSKPLFEFDSTEPADLNLTKTEFDQLVESSTEQVLMGAIDLEGKLDQTQESEPEPAEQGIEEDGDVISGASFQGKYWRWSGRLAIKALESIVESNPDLKFYRSELNRLSGEKMDDVSLEQLVALQPAVFMLSSNELADLQFLVRDKRWEDRIGHPQAVTMFLTFLPKKMFSEFFETFDSCVLIHENDVELLRAKRTI